MNRKNLIIVSSIFLVVIALIWYLSSSDTSDSETIKVEVKNGEFVIEVTTTGELEARSSEDIKGPNFNAMRNARIHMYTIEDIVPDGTVVDSGDWVATLDRSDLQTKISDQELEVEQLQTEFIKTQLDTTLTLRAARDEIINLQFSLEEAKIILDQSIYEPPATQRQVQIDYEKAKRTLDQTKENYNIQHQKAVAEMREVATDLQKEKSLLNEFNDLKDEFLVMAPKSGMVNYKKDWSGKKVGVGSQVNMWENVVAKLPNLSAMNSKTYVNEIDISKVVTGQDAIIQVDAYPGKEFTGKVFEVANMGEQMTNSNAKVFEVIIHVDGYDSILRPAMTTKNRIITEVIDSVKFIPIECVNVEDSLNFVYVSGNRKQVIPGKTNETSIIIHEGLDIGDEVYLVPPEGAEDWSIELLDENIVKKYNDINKKEVKKLPAKEDMEKMQMKDHKPKGDFKKRN